MPRIPQYGESKVRAIGTPTPDVVQNVPVPNIAGAVGNVVDAFADIREEANRTAVTEAERKVLDLDFSTFDDPEKGYLRQQGKMAIEGYQKTIDGYDAGLSTIRSGLKNDDQRRLFDEKVATSRRQQARLTAARHMSQERERFDENEMAGRLDGAVGAAARHADDPARVGYELGTARADLAAYLKRKGIADGSEAFADRMRDFDTKGHEAVIDSLLSRPGGAGKAKAYLDTVRDSIAGDRLDEIDKNLSEFMAGEKSAGAVDVAFDAFRRTGDLGKAELDMIDGLKGDAKAQGLARQELRQRAAAFNESQDVQLGKAMQWALANGSYSYASLPRDLRAGLSPDKDVKLREWLDGKIDAARARVDPADKVRAMDLWTNLPRRPDFKDADLTPLAPVFLAAGEEARYDQLVREQEALRKGKAGDEWAMAEPTLKARMRTLGIESKDARSLQATDYVRRQIEAERVRLNRALNRKEVDDIIDQSFVRGEIQREWAPDPDAYQFQAGYADGPFVGGVPLADYQKIADSLRAAGEEVTPENVESVYRQFQSQAQ